MGNVVHTIPSAHMRCECQWYMFSICVVTMQCGPMAPSIFYSTINYRFSFIRPLILVQLRFSSFSQLRTITMDCLGAKVQTIPQVHVLDRYQHVEIGERLQKSALRPLVFYLFPLCSSIASTRAMIRSAESKRILELLKCLESDGNLLSENYKCKYLAFTITRFPR